MSELKPCQSCGGEAEIDLRVIRQRYDDFNKREFYRAMYETDPPDETIGIKGRIFCKKCKRTTSWYGQVIQVLIPPDNDEDSKREVEEMKSQLTDFIAARWNDGETHEQKYTGR